MENIYTNKFSIRFFDFVYKVYYRLNWPVGTVRRMAMAISGDYANTKAVVAVLINDIGFDVEDAGNLSESWRHQPGTPAYYTELNATVLKQALVDGVNEKILV